MINNKAALRALAFDVRLKAASVQATSRLRPYERLQQMRRIIALAEEVDRLVDAPVGRKSEECFEAILRELGRAGAFPDGSLVVAAAFSFAMD
jgi:hypothetical protein